MELRLLGPLEVVDGGGRVLDLRGEKQRGLLALLGLRAGEVVPVGRLVEELWGEDTISDPLNALQVVVSKVRRALRGLPGSNGSQLIVTSPSGYVLDLDHELVDVLRFERLVAEGRRQLAAGAPDVAALTLREALQLWRGPALVDLDEQFAQGDRVRLEELRADALELRIDSDLELGHHDQLTAELAALTLEHPLRERLRAQQMLALYRSGRQAEALRAFQNARHMLGEELGLDPGPELQQLEAAIAVRDPSLAPTTAPRASDVTAAVRATGNLRPAISSFVGRSEEVEVVQDLVAKHRLVTLVGPGGAGKTRLALEVAAAMQTRHPDGTWVIELAPLLDPLDVGPAMATGLGLDDVARVEPFLAGKAVLLVIDNCEHVIDAAAAAAEQVLRAGADVRVLATSRELLGVVGEVVWRVPPLAASDASKLFMERADAAAFESADGSQLVSRICDRLDGLPLAVELAAARTRSLSLADISARLDDRFRLLTTGGRTAEPRQQTLRAVVDWSYELLFADEQRLFRRLSVFAGGFDIEAAEAICADEEVANSEVVDLLERLVDKSLVSVASRSDTTRYQLLQTLVDYGRERLVEAGEEHSIRERHLDYVVSFAADAEPGLRGPDQSQWIERLDRELDNARSALEWARHRGRTADAVAMAGCLAYGWYITGTVQEGRIFITRALADDGPSSAEHRAIAGAWGAWLIQIGSGATEDAVAYSEQAVEVARGRSTRGFCSAAIVAALLRAYRGRTIEAAQLLEEADRVLSVEPDRWCQAFVDWVGSGLALKMGDVARASDLLSRSIDHFRAEGDRYGEAIVSIRLGELAELRGDYDQAVAATTFAYEGTSRTGAGANSSILPTRLGNLAALQGRFDDAAQWHATALERARELGFPGPAAQALSGMGVSAVQQGLLADAESLHRQALAAYEAVGSVEGAAFTYACLGFLASMRGDVHAAEQLHRRSLRRAVVGNERRAMALAVEGFAGVRAGEGDALEAARLSGVARELRGDGLVVTPWLTAERTRVEQLVRSMVGDAGYDAAFESGRNDAESTLAGLVATVASDDD